MHELHHPPPPTYWGMTAEEVTQDVLRSHESPGGGFWKIAGLLAALFGLGIAGFAILLSQGFEDRNVWGYYVTVFAYIFTTAQSAILVSVALRMAKAHWRRPLARISELFAVVGLFNFFLLIPLLWVLPVTDNRRSIWFEWPGHSPHLWDTISLGLLVVCGLALLYFALHTGHGRRERPRHRRTASPVPPHVLQLEGKPPPVEGASDRMGLLGGFYFLLLIFVHMMISVDFAMSLVPGWKDSIFPAFHALNGIQSGVALILVTMFILRWKTGLRKYLEVDQFWGLSKLLLALSLLWFYFWWSGFFVYWYGRTPAEQSVLKFHHV